MLTDQPNQTTGQAAREGSGREKERAEIRQGWQEVGGNSGAGRVVGDREEVTPSEWVASGWRRRCGNWLGMHPVAELPSTNIS